MFQRVRRERRMFGKEGGRKRDGEPGSHILTCGGVRRALTGVWEEGRGRLKGESKESYQSFISAYES